MSKKVNVKRLKVDIWTHLDELEAKSSVPDRRSAENSIISDKGGKSLIHTVLGVDIESHECKFF